MHKWQISSVTFTVPYCRLECWTEESDVQHSGVDSICQQSHFSPPNCKKTLAHQLDYTNSALRPVALITH
jgi:hypothetical protein